VPSRFRFSLTVYLLTRIAPPSPTTTECHCRRTTQLPAPAIPCSRCRRSHPPGINPRLSRHERGRTDQRGLARRELHRSLRNHCCRIWCVRHQWSVVSSLFLADEPRSRFPAPEMLSAYPESECSSTVVSLDLDNNARPAPPNVQTAVRPTRPFSSVFSGRGQAVRKPVIYLYPPSRLPDVTVELLLTSSWSFSAIYPLPQTAITSSEKQIAGQSLTWTVEAEPDGTLVDKTSGTEVSYLYWEATYVMLFCVARPTAINLFFFPRIFGFSSANSRLATPDASRATTPVEDIETFDPSRPSLSPGDSILLPIGKIPSYLDAALKALTLHTEARTSFITYASSLFRRV
jgi:hypothetical protein